MTATLAKHKQVKSEEEKGKEFKTPTLIAFRCYATGIQ